MYAFCQNNPVMNLDPSGYLSKWAKIGIRIGVGIGISLITGGAGSGIGAAIIIGAIEGAAEQTITNAIEGKNLTDGVVESVVIGGISGAVGYGVGAAAIKGVSKLKSISKVSKGVSKLDNARALGKAGEEASGIIKNTKRIPSFTGKAKYRIPDGLDDYALTEVKNVAYQGYTSQLKDFHHYSQSNNLDFILYTRPNTRISGPLQNLIDNSDIIHKFLP